MVLSARAYQTFSLFFLTTFSLLLFSSSHLLAVETFLVVDSPTEQPLPRNFRTTNFPFLDAVASPSRQGFDNLALSGSGQFSTTQFDFMKTKIGKPLVVVDLRQEYHGFLNGVAVCWFSYRDAANRGLDYSQVIAGEENILAEVRSQDEVILGTSIKKTPDGGFDVVKNSNIRPKTVFSEQEFMASRGDGYFRIASTDHLRPTNDSIERFVLFTRQLEPGVWVHFHCRAGIGRTTTFMLMYDMLRNAQTLDFETLAQRQYYIGGTNFLKKESSHLGWKQESARERVLFLRQFYNYAENNPGGFPKSWLEWLGNE